MHFRTLKKSDLGAMRRAFNLAFENYFVDMHMDEAAFQQRFLKKEKISFRCSGAFFNEQGEMVAFIFHSKGRTPSGELVAYNAGTGVLPDYRGQGLSSRLYEKLIPRLRKAGIEKMLLEVITENHAAIKSYEKIQFRQQRQLDFYGVRALKTPSSKREAVTVRWQDKLPFDQFSDWNPSWPLIPAHFKAIRRKLNCYGVYESDQLIGYAVANPKSGRIMYYGVHREYRARGVGAALFERIITDSEKDISLLNIDASDQNSSRFLEKMGLEVKISQYEMSRQI